MNSEISVILPVFNEEKNISIIFEELKTNLERTQKNYEIIFIDDGSIDGSFRILSEIAQNYKQVKVIRLQRNFGQTAAIMAGLESTSGKVIIFMDADLQNNPADISLLLQKMEQGYDVVSGWRRKRKDPLFTRKVPSWIANKIISLISGVRLHDYGCTLKSYRSDFIKKVKLYGEMHRFIPIYTFWQGANIAEIEVNHRPRKYGKSKYGLSRTFKVLLDLLTVKFLNSYLSKPIYIFGGSGLLLLTLGVIVGVITLIQKYFYQVWIHRNPLLLLAVFLFILGMLFVILGLLGEVLVRTYYEISNEKPYRIKETINLR